jgi:hypothetical protein
MIDQIVEENVIEEEGNVIEETVVQEEQQSIGVTTLTQVVMILNKIPNELYDSTMELTTKISQGLRSIGKAFRGESTSSDDNRGYASVKKSHFEFAERLRRENKALYLELITFGKTVSGMDDSTKPQTIKAFFMQKLTDLQAPPIPSSKT